MKRSRAGWVLAAVVAAAWAAAAQAAVTLNGMFTDGAVLQQEMAVPIWGTAAPNEEVKVTFAGQTKRAKADAGGRWMVRLSPMKASSEPRPLVVEGATPDSKVTLAGVLVGEVWICSGQSNMQFSLGSAVGGTNAALEAKDPLLRLYKAPMVKSDSIETVITGRWTSCEYSNSVGFSGVAFFFGRELRAARKVPVGLIQSAWGGTPAEAWTPLATLQAHPDLKSILDDHAKAVREWNPFAVDSNFAKALAAWSNQVAKAKLEGREQPRRPTKPESPATKPQRPYCLYNAMIHPLVPYALRGAIWYQGESNSGRAAQYATLFPVMIQSWRKAWGQGDFPFLFVQIAPHCNMVPEIREAQLLSWKSTPNTAMAVITDIGEEKDIHPKKKAEVGARLCLAARALAYRERGVVYSGPVYRAMKVAGGRALLEFDHAGSGLVAAEGGLKDFTIAPAGSTNFVSAQAVIEGSKVAVSAPGVATPGAVRYGWTNWFVGSLFNKEGLPATPFRTDLPK